MPLPLPLRGLVFFVDRTLDPRTATRNAKRAAADLAEHLRQMDDVERALRRIEQGDAAEPRSPVVERRPSA
ncbi:MAG TPA: hypothetical protein VFH66_06780 [Mycobacteriales bacterium]|nr:hypothetical protein [Mycobacteriales bacterium]